MYENNTMGTAAQDQPQLDRTTERLVSELAARILQPLRQELSKAAPEQGQGMSLDEAAQAMRGDLERMTRTLQADIQREDEHRQALLRSLAAAVDDLSSLRVLLGNAAEAISAARLPENARALKDAGEAASRTESAIQASAGRIETAIRSSAEKQQNALTALQDGLAALSSAPRPNAAELRETAGAISRLEKALKDSQDEERSGRQAMLRPLGALLDDMAALRGALNDALGTLNDDAALEETLNKLVSEFEELKGEWRQRAEQDLEQRGELSATAAALAGAVGTLKQEFEKERVNRAKAPDIAALTQLLDVSIPSWEGLLRAHNQAQTQELDALSRELANLQSQTGEALSEKLQDTIRRAMTERDEVWSRRLEAEQALAAQREKTLTRTLWALAGLGGLSLLVGLLGLFF